MKALDRKREHKKALIAVVFAGSILNTSLPGLCENQLAESSFIGQEIANNAKLIPEMRAFFLLYLARDYIAGRDSKQIQSSFNQVATQARNSVFQNSRSRKQVFDSWTKQVLEGGFFSVHDRSVNPTPKTAEFEKENRAHASHAVDLALTQLEKSTDEYTKLNMYFIALRMYERAKNVEGASKCQKLIEQSIHSSEVQSTIDEQQMEACYDVLNLLAATIIPVIITDREPRNGIEPRKFIVNSHTEKLFKQSEKIRLRAVAIADRLDKEKHLRRKAHRDMALWYTKLDKKDLAEKEKLVLFDLVGIHDDSILYPVEVGCGHLEWWKKQNSVFGIDCGMG